jgi:His-Xaa-Ser system radical SAM maturase HxsC
MKLRIKGKSFNIQEPVVKPVTRYLHLARANDYAFLCHEIPLDFEDLTIITTNMAVQNIQNVKLVCVPEIDHLMEGDIVGIFDNGLIRTLYQKNAVHNSILVTERCNSNCLMCSQPPKDVDDIELLHNLHKKLIPLIPKNCKQIGITGGEPTILGNKLLELIRLFKEELPNTGLHILSNGRSFSYGQIAKKISDINHPDLMFGIPIYSDYYQIHDYVVQARNAFYQTILGIQNLKRFGVPVEIRIVLHEITITRLPKLAEYIYKNMPYVDHVAFMGLEITGFTLANMEKLWIDPVNYMNELEEAVLFLDNRGIHVSIFNTPLCLLPKTLWHVSRKSISDWKNVYFEECKKCSEVEKCGGFFESSEKKHSQFIKAIVS